ncbi:MAG TPA: T9SS type A sorting domain-containing protein [Ignavibacteriaceae bacterium]|nr:T9SS type A sorting domain-containing protein [Ignavibacteriaceae bacterium]
MPTDYQLSQNYPNTLNPTTTIKYDTPETGRVSLKIYDILGSEVITLLDEVKSAGRYEGVFNASNLASGVYICTIQAEYSYHSRKMILLK